MCNLKSIVFRLNYYYLWAYQTRSFVIIKFPSQEAIETSNSILQFF